MAHGNPFKPSPQVPAQSEISPPPFSIDFLSFKRHLNGLDRYLYIYILITSEIPNSSDSLAPRLPSMEKSWKSHGKVMEDPRFPQDLHSGHFQDIGQEVVGNIFFWGVSTGQQTEGWLAILKMEHISIKFIDR